ncbi:MAG: phosphate signaling complex protein PhoU [Bdellovibrionaceae bacterium]|nr:phosphate signaling complex protein PhoU [Pseudobdellovibrionaceae bacterium]MBX3034481.1 phosphate signaling complex protein PhoU [Pseudobdellovibrionaceae bacterium]
MERAFDTQLEDLKRQILVMGGHVEKALTEVTTALLNRDEVRFAGIRDIEKKINDEHIKVDNSCLNLLAKQSPVAKDLRLILSIIKINTDLERMGDQTMNIAYTGRDYLGRKPLVQVADVSRMGEIARRMVKGALDCFVRGDVEHAREILLMDDQVDELKNSVFHQLAAHMKSNPGDVEAGLDLILIARNLERMGDHATNIAEDVIFAETGKDVRHGGLS